MEKVVAARVDITPVMALRQLDRTWRPIGLKVRTNKKSGPKLGEGWSYALPAPAMGHVREWVRSGILLMATRVVNDGEMYELLVKVSAGKQLRLS